MITTDSASLTKLLEGQRSRQETWCLELMPIIHGIHFLQRRRVELTFMPGTNRVIYQPLDSGAHDFRRGCAQ